MSTLCVGSIEYCTRNSLNEEQQLWVRLKIICEPDGKTLWRDTFNSIENVKESLKDNDIDYYDIIDVGNDTYVARAKAESINQFAEWRPGTDTEDMCVRTFLTVIDANSNQDIFERDSCWLTTLLGDDTVDKWFQYIKSIPINTRG